MEVAIPKATTHLITEATYTIPEPFETEIGRIIVRWAYSEDLSQWIVWELLNLDASYGRLAVREPRMRDRLDLIRDLAKLRGIKLFRNWAAFKMDADALSQKRDLLAHGVWMNTGNGKWYLERTHGSYTPAAFPEKTNRRIEPTAMEATIDGLQSISAGIENLIRPATRFHDSCHAIRQTWRDTRS